MARFLRFWKPFGVLSQFTDRSGRPTLAEYIDVPGVYAAGRLDMDSEGLLLLTDSGALKTRIADPRHEMRKRYLALVETPPDPAALERLLRGVILRDGPARALTVRSVDAPALPPRDPAPAPRPGRATGWVELEIDEGRNRQVRRMLAAVGSPVLRLLRTAVGPFTLAGLAPGEWVEQSLHAPVSGPGVRTPGPRPRRPDDRRRETRSSTRRRSGVPSSRRRRGS
ncbi:MAG: pseudouridine synthase [Pseudomonadales bacterium]|jgi:23S rRNA pseudouridine2457 synthase|nr:pseudouridine synthase [Pseudomonadales bacterium]